MDDTHGSVEITLTDWTSVGRAVTAISAVMQKLPVPIHAAYPDSSIELGIDMTGSNPTPDNLVEVPWSTADSRWDEATLRRVIVDPYVNEIQGALDPQPRNPFAPYDASVLGTDAAGRKAVPKSVLDSVPWGSVSVFYQGHPLMELTYEPEYQMYLQETWQKCGLVPDYSPTSAYGQNGCGCFKSAVSVLGGTYQEEADAVTWTIGGATWRATNLYGQPTNSAAESDFRPQITRSGSPIPTTGKFLRSTPGWSTTPPYMFSLADAEAMLGVTITIDKSTGIATR